MPRPVADLVGAGAIHVPTFVAIFVRLKRLHRHRPKGAVRLCKRIDRIIGPPLTTGSLWRAPKPMDSAAADGPSRWEGSFVATSGLLLSMFYHCHDAWCVSQGTQAYILAFRAVAPLLVFEYLVRVTDDGDDSGEVLLSTKSALLRSVVRAKALEFEERLARVPFLERYPHLLRLRELSLEMACRLAPPPSEEARELTSLKTDESGPT
jgi:hypothetical protein